MIQRAVAWVGGVAVVLLLIATLGVAIPAGLADAATLSSRNQVAEWRATGAPSPDTHEWKTVQAQLRQGLLWTPNDPNLHDHLAFLLALQAFEGTVSLEMQRELLTESLQHYQQAAHLRPMLGHGWAYVALITHVQVQAGTAALETVWPLLTKALQYGGRELRVLDTVLEIFLVRWSSTPYELQERFKHVLLGLTEKQKKSLQVQAQVLGYSDLFEQLPVSQVALKGKTDAK